MTPMINTDDLLDAQGVADLLGLRHPNSVHTYLRRYPDMPRPILDLGPGRPRLWLRPEVERWRLGRRPVPAATAAGSTAAGSTAAGSTAAAATTVPTLAAAVFIANDRQQA
jgi:glutathione-regulated potassium-efflux system ancillary protein KefG